MNSLKHVKKEFNHRHNFEDEDIEILKERWVNVEFESIPVAWIILIDEMLTYLRYNNPISKIKQDFGQLIIQTNKKPTEKQSAVIKLTEEKIRSIDEDLYIFCDITMDKSALN